MKRTWNKICAGIIACVTCWSCNDWLDVDSSTTVTQEQLYGSYEGFRTAINGLYYLISQQDLYGRDLTWGAASVLGQNYDNKEVNARYWDLASYTYGTSSANKITDPIWKRAFNVIANCNNLIQQVETKDTTFFPYGKVERDLVLGEALGMRALMHFEIMRLYAPAPVQDDGKRYIPYVTSYPLHFPEKETVDYVMGRIIEDLESAKTCLAYHDTLYNVTAIKSVEARIKANMTTVKGGLFFNGRATRMNYFAASALLARAYLWKGDKVNALRCANDVYAYGPDGLSGKNWFFFTIVTNMGEASTKNDVYRKMYEDILFTAVNQTEYELFEADREPGSFYYLKNTDLLFGEDKDDCRLKVLIGSDNTSLRWQSPDALTDKAKDIIAYQGPLAPVIRLSEVYHIMCECLADTDLPRAVSLLQALRVAREAKIPLNVTSRDEFLEILYNDIIRETLSEGGSFYMHKRLGRDMYNGEEDPVDMTGRWVVPAPESETDI